DLTWNDEFEVQIREDESKQILGLGDNGAAATLPPEYEANAEEVMKVEAFNLLLSNLIMYNRTVADARHPLCKKKVYDDDLPTASVVIIFTNERWSSLIRTIHSIINGSPKKFLKEIILVDDNSDHDELMGKLNYYIATRFPAGLVKLKRMGVRSGLIRARLAGAEVAKGDVLVFLDAHCEVGPVWLEPLLQRIKEKRNTVVVPIIDVIDDKTFEYQHNKGSYEFQVGGFTWSGHFTWIDISQEELARRTLPTDPTRSPTMAGGLFAVERSYFWESGSYDREMDVWGGENLEMSFRIWQCGGSLETVPCSRVGHIFRNFHPYTFPGHKDTHGINTARLVNVWMDDYKRLFFLYRPDLKTADIGDLTERLMLKERLKCKDFNWFLKNIYKDKFILDEEAITYGKVGTATNNLCLDNLQKPDDERYHLGVYTCHGKLFPSQFFSMSKSGELRREFLCAEIDSENRVMMDKCRNTDDQIWEITPVSN
ncbi:hypothetical protein AAG570_002142, partial [Ranatra chinensis]